MTGNPYWWWNGGENPRKENYCESYNKKNINLKELEKFGFIEDENLKTNKPCYSREVKFPVFLIADKETRELSVKTPLGTAVFIESHKDKYEDLLDAKIVEFIN